MLKCVMFRADGRHYLAVTRADRKVDLEKCRRLLGVHDAELEREDEFRRVFEDCELGAMPPFGNLWGIQTILDDDIPRGAEVAFNAGDHATLVEMDFDDYDRLVIRGTLPSPPAPGASGRNSFVGETRRRGVYARIAPGNQAGRSSGRDAAGR